MHQERLGKYRVELGIGEIEFTSARFKMLECLEDLVNSARG
jgi:hypothetical protein